MITIKNKKEIELMKEACKVVALVYEDLKDKIKPGMTTYELDQIAEAKMRSLGAIPAEKGYDIGVNGVPSKHKIIHEGDIVSVDTVALKDGYNGDAARTFTVGKVSKDAERLIAVTKQAFFEGIKYAKPGYRIGDISNAIGTYVESQGYSVVREFQGHGIGQDMHEDPGIPNYGKAGRGPRIEPGMTLAIEPMVIAGKPDILELDDGWTIITEEGTLAAHYENTILVTNGEPEILTMTKREKQEMNIK